MRDSLFISALTIGVILIVFFAALAVAHLSGANAPAAMTPASAQMAPLQNGPGYSVGDVLRSEDTNSFVIVTGYDAAQDMYFYQPVSVNFSRGSVSIREGTGTMERGDFESRYPFAVSL